MTGTHNATHFKYVLYFKTFKVLLHLSCKQVLKIAFEVRQITFFLIFQMPNEKHQGASLVAQWLRIHLPMQGTRVRSLVWEDLTCRGATKPTRHNY